MWFTQDTGVHQCGRRARRRRGALGVFALALIGCATDAPPAPNPGDLPRDSGRVVFAEMRFADAVRVGEIGAARTEDDLLALDVPLTNLSAGSLRVELEIEFLDADGNAFHDHTGRINFCLARGQTDSLEVTSMRSAAADFVLTVCNIDEF